MKNSVGATYGYRKRGYGKTKVDPEIAVAELERIREINGMLTPDLIVNDAEREDSPLHPIFEWDDDKASHLYRMDQARHLIRAIVVTQDNKPAQMVYVHVQSGGNQYMPLSIVVNTPDLYREALDDAREYLTQARNRVDELLSVGPQPRSRHIERAASSIASAAKELERETAKTAQKASKEPVAAAAAA